MRNIAASESKKTARMLPRWLHRVSQPVNNFVVNWKVDHQKRPLINQKILEHNSREKEIRDIMPVINQKFHGTSDMEEKQRLHEQYMALQGELQRINQERESLFDSRKKLMTFSKAFGLSAVGAAAGAAVSKGMRRAGGGAVNTAGNVFKREHSLSHLVVFLLFLAAYFFTEYSNQGLSLSWNPGRVAIVTIFILYLLIFVRWSDNKSAVESGIFAAIWTLLIPLFAGMIQKASFFNIGSGTLSLFLGLLAPGILWWFLLFDPHMYFPEPLKIIMFIVIFAMLMSYVSPHLSILNGQFGNDQTGFSFGKFTGQLGQSLSGGLKTTFGGTWCYITHTCGGYSGWLNAITEPFAYDATTVNQLQNANLGVYVEQGSVKIPSQIDTTQYNGNKNGLLPDTINFYLNSPIPDSLTFDLCNVQPDSGLKGFAGICDNNVTVGCGIQDVAKTKVTPDITSIRSVIASKRTLMYCSMGLPNSLGQKQINITVDYPFVTDTFKLINAVRLSQTNSNDVIKQLNNVPSDQIISTGGPVIIASNENTYITLSPDSTNTFNLKFTFKTQQNSKLLNVTNITIYVPQSTSIKPLEGIDACDVDHGEVKQLGTNGKWAKVYHINQTGIDYINNYLKSAGVNSEVSIPCQFTVENIDTFLNPSELVTQRLINIVSSYNVRNIYKGTVDFTGKLAIGQGSGPNAAPSTLAPEDAVNTIIDAAKKYGEDPLLLAAIAEQESNMNQNDRSSDGGIGIMQITRTDCPETMKDKANLEPGSYSYNPPSQNYLNALQNETVNIYCGAEILKKKYDTYKNGLVDKNRNKIFCSGTEYSRRYDTYFTYNWIDYTGWKSATKGYNGASCDPSFVNSYAEQVQHVMDLIRQGYYGDYVSTQTNANNTNPAGFVMA